MSGDKRENKMKNEYIEVSLNVASMVDKITEN